MKSLEVFIRIYEKNIRDLRFQYLVLEEKEKELEEKKKSLWESQIYEQEQLSLPTSVFFPSYAQFVGLQIEEIGKSIRDLQEQKEIIIEKIVTEFISLKKYSLINEKIQKETQSLLSKKEQKELDDLSSFFSSQKNPRKL